MSAATKIARTGVNRRKPKGDKGRRTKLQIQQAIIDLFSIDGLGLNEIKLDRICKTAGVTIGAFYFHFENKDAAIFETAGDALNEFKAELAAIPQENDLYSELKKIILVYIRSMVRGPQQSRLVYAAIRSSPAVHRAYEDMHLEISGRLQALIAARRSEQGADRSESQLIVEFLMAGIESFLENVYMWDNDKISGLGDDPEALARKLSAMWVNMATTQLGLSDS